MLVSSRSRWVASWNYVAIQTDNNPGKQVVSVERRIERVDSLFLFSY